MSEAMEISLGVAGNRSRNNNNSGQSWIPAESRRVSITEEDSRECPTQMASEMERGNAYHMGIDERRGLPQYQYQRPLQQVYQHPIGGHHCHQGQPFRERRDSNSFDCDSDSEDDFVIHRKLLRRRHVRKHQLQKEREQKQQQQLAAVAAAIEAARRNSLAASGDINANCAANKRKNPCPVVGEEPFESTHEVSMEEVVSIDEDDQTADTDISFDDSTRFDPSPETEDISMLPSPTRRISLSPVSRRLACQFDSISFFSPVKASKNKRRKVWDTSAVA